MKRRLIAIGACVLVFGCGQPRKEIGETRVVRRAAAPASDARSAPNVPPVGAEPAAPYRWEMPSGWAEQPPTAMRQVNFVISGDPPSECYMTVLPGNGGGVAANINRWRGQMGLPDLTENEIGDLPKIRMLNQEVPLIEASGEYTGMGGEKRPDMALLGVVCQEADRSVFVKMIGPAAAVAAQKASFETFCASLATSR